ncbi:hypothetical protein FQZ97_959890 [compost metagenome]
MSKLALASRPETISTAISQCAGNTMGRLDRVWGAIGTITQPPMAGCSSGPPAESEYAVEPVDEAMIRPSARWLATKWPSTSTRSSIMLATPPRLTTTSLSAVASNTHRPSRHTLAAMSARGSSSNSPYSMGRSFSR